MPLPPRTPERWRATARRFPRRHPSHRTEACPVFRVTARPKARGPSADRGPWRVDTPHPISSDRQVSPLACYLPASLSSVPAQGPKTSCRAPSPGGAGWSRPSARPGFVLDQDGCKPVRLAMPRSRGLQGLIPPTRPYDRKGLGSRSPILSWRSLPPGPILERPSGLIAVANTNAWCRGAPETPLGIMSRETLT